MINIGKYPAICRSIQFGTTSTGKEQVAVEFEILPFADGPGEFAGQSITAFMFFTEKTLARTVESLRHCGWVGDDLAELPALAADGKLSQEVEIVVDHEEYEGKVSAKVKWVNKPGGGGAIKLEKPLDDAGLRTFAARMKASIRSSQAPQRSASSSSASKPSSPTGNGSRSAAPASRDVPPPSDDDRLPF